MTAMTKGEVHTEEYRINQHRADDDGNIKLLRGILKKQEAQQLPGSTPALSSALKENERTNEKDKKEWDGQVFRVFK